MKQYMISFRINQNPDEYFFNLIPVQRAVINKLMESGKILSYTLDENRTHLWCIANANDEESVRKMIAEFPLIDYMRPRIFPLMFHNSVVLSLPKFSLN
jgi:muconolactone delta-isomerase